MRWLFTNYSEAIAGIAAAGEEVVGSADDYQAPHLPWLAEIVSRLVPGPGDPVARAFDAIDTNPAWAAGDDPFAKALFQLEGPINPNVKTSDYPLHMILMQHRPEVLVLTPFYQPGFGFPLGSINKWLNQASGGATRILVGIGQDPQTMDMVNRSRYRGCACRMDHLVVYASDDAGAARKAAGERRAVFWRPGDSVAPLLEAVRHAGRREMYNLSKGRPWLPA